MYNKFSPETEVVHAIDRRSYPCTVCGQDATYWQFALTLPVDCDECLLLQNNPAVRQAAAAPAKPRRVCTPRGKRLPAAPAVPRVWVDPFAHYRAMPPTTGPRVLLTVGSWSEEIAAALTARGAAVFVLEQERRMTEAYRWASHVLIPGGGDIHPAYYNQPANNALVGKHPAARDRLEYRLVDQSLLDAKPLLGICRGHQMIAVVAGGSLYQDIELELGNPHAYGFHGAYGMRASLAAKLLGKRFGVNSYHHQAVNRVPIGWRVDVLSEDGIVESIRCPGKPVLSVQWHPEVMDPMHRAALFGRWLEWR